MMMRTLSAVALFAVAAGTLLSGFQEIQEIQKDSKPFMKRKLDSSLALVEGLAVEDYPKIAKGAQDLILLSQESGWNVIQTESYLRMSREFRESTERLRDSADAKNIDAATLAYFEVTLNCVRCHKYLRKKPEQDK